MIGSQFNPPNLILITPTAAQGKEDGDFDGKSFILISMYIMLAD